MSTATDWRWFAACADKDPELWFHSGRGLRHEQRAELAKQVCADCPVREECLRESLQLPDEYGIWGGMVEDQRMVLRRRMRRRPRRWSA